VATSRDASGNLFEVQIGPYRASLNVYDAKGYIIEQSESVSIGRWDIDSRSIEFKARSGGFGPWRPNVLTLESSGGSLTLVPGKGASALGSRPLSVACETFDPYLQL
jgi:hypothetical protein